jgi:hypothetical protein
MVVAAMLAGHVTVTHAQAAAGTAPCATYDESCKSFIKKAAIGIGAVIALVVVLSAVKGHNKRAKADAAPSGLNVYYTPTGGTALEHMVMSPKSGNCPGSWTIGESRLLSGTLPPGLKLTPAHRIEGTPFDPGTWEARIELSGLRCEGRDGKARTYGDKVVNVTIKIE